MLRITVEVVPYGDESQKSTLSQFEVVNQGHIQNGLYGYYVRKERHSDVLGEFTHVRHKGLNNCLRWAFTMLDQKGLDKI